MCIGPRPTQIADIPVCVGSPQVFDMVADPRQLQDLAPLRHVRADINALLKIAVQIMKQQHSAPVIDPCYALAGREEGAGEGPGDLVMY